MSAPATVRAAVRRAIAHAGARLPPRWRGFAAACTVYGLSLLVQAVLHRLLAATSLVASLLAPSPATPWFALATAVGFVSLRVLTLALAPALLAGWSAALLIGPWRPDGAAGRTAPRAAGVLAGTIGRDGED